MLAPAPLSRRRLLAALPARTATTAAPAALVASVTIYGDFNSSCPASFDPPDLTIAAGTTVTWANACGAPVVLAVAAASAPTAYQAWQSDEIADGESWSSTFNTQGSFPYLESKWQCGGGSITIT